MSEEVKKKEYRLPKEITLKWLEALRSGQYKQTKHDLKDDNFGGCKHCCLGVLCEVLDVPNNFVIERADLNNLSWDLYAGTPNTKVDWNNIDVARQAAFEKYGLPLELTNGGDLAAELMNLNDEVGYSFKEIADWIEQMVELY